jgi:hypothetical protein
MPPRGPSCATACQGGHSVRRGGSDHPGSVNESGYRSTPGRPTGCLGCDPRKRLAGRSAAATGWLPALDRAFATTAGWHAGCSFELGEHGATHHPLWARRRGDVLRLQRLRRAATGWRRESGGISSGPCAGTGWVPTGLLGPRTCDLGGSPRGVDACGAVVGPVKDGWRIGPDPHVATQRVGWAIRCR